MAQINKPNEYFNTVLYTGDGSSPRSLTGVNFQPDWVWLKRRNDAASHTLYDVVRTAGSTKGIATNSTVEEGLTASEGTTANFGYINSFDSDGFSVTTGASSDGYVNNSSDTYVAWNWLGGGTGVSNTDGDITSTVSANTTSGFSVVSYTGNGTNGATIGHGLGVAPKMVIPKCRSDAGDWSCYHASLSASNNIFLNLTQAQSAIVDRDNGGISTTSSTTFTVAQGGSTLNNVNGSGRTYIAYCFAEKKGFSKFGSYTGNGSTDGTFVYTGFKPAFVIVKKYNTTEDWFMYDNKRNGFNPDNFRLKANDAASEDPLSTGQIDLLSNGWKFRNSGTQYNASGDSYIYMAFAENPLVGTNNIPTTAR
jgi:hypothetical protein